MHFLGKYAMYVLISLVPEFTLTIASNISAYHSTGMHE